jgi:small-conductance mechanosensitive channel
MEQKTSIKFAIILLIVALFGLIVLYLESYISQDVLFKAQIGAILYLALLSFGIFFQNNKEKLASRVNPKLHIIINNFGWVVFVLFGLDLIYTQVIYFAVTHTFYIPMLVSTIVAIGLYIANGVFKQVT